MISRRAGRMVASSRFSSRVSVPDRLEQWPPSSRSQSASPPADHLEAHERIRVDLARVDDRSTRGRVADLVNHDDRRKRMADRLEEIAVGSKRRPDRGPVVLQPLAAFCLEKIIERLGEFRVGDDSFGQLRPDDRKGKRVDTVDDRVVVRCEDRMADERGLAGLAERFADLGVGRLDRGSSEIAGPASGHFERSPRRSRWLRQSGYGDAGRA